MQLSIAKLENPATGASLRDRDLEIVQDRHPDVTWLLEELQAKRDDVEDRYDLEKANADQIDDLHYDLAQTDDKLQATRRALIAAANLAMTGKLSQDALTDLNNLVNEYV